MKHKPVNLAGKLSLKEYISFLKQIKLFITNEVNKINKVKLDFDNIKQQIQKEYGKDSYEFKKLGEYEKELTCFNLKMDVCFYHVDTYNYTSQI